MKIKFVVPSYNVEKWCKYTINSIKLQTYKDFECVVIDDMSTDCTFEKLKKLCGNDNRFKLIKNTEKKYALRNIIDGFKILNPMDDDILLALDGDDWFFGKEALQKVYEAHNNGAWLTYGSYIEYPSNSKGRIGSQLPKEVIENNSYRDYKWSTSQLRTFRFGLWKRIKNESFLDSSGNYYRMAWDLSLMFPMLEMAAERSKFISDYIYVYNLDNSLNDFKISRELQVKLEMEIRKKERYSRIQNYK